MFHDIGFYLIPVARVLLNFFAISTNGQQTSDRLDAGKCFFQLLVRVFAGAVSSVFVYRDLDSSFEIESFIWFENVAVGLSPLGSLERCSITIPGQINDRNLQGVDL